MDFGQGPSRDNPLFAPLYPHYGDYNAADERQDEDDLDVPQQPQKRSRLVRYPLSEWTKLGMPGMIKLMHQVQSLWWVPVLYDEGAQSSLSPPPRNVATLTSCFYRVSGLSQLLYICEDTLGFSEGSFAAPSGCESPK